ncbi:sensor histidine kinase [Methylobacillus gramineus]|uniref:ATP-binding protein n=1 Tax=Methylobacillus gramineus TaxID=755169 RepID=UPI001CFFF1A2|nr:ATP-binding protein [Methylobacillus gramineus]MCB5186274.1 sensor histidine kinase [Methylobacillus gramineus]
MSSLASITNLRRLLWLRVVMMLALALASVIAVQSFHITLPVAQISIAISLMCCINLLSWLRLWRKARIMEGELLAQLLLDIALLTWLFYVTGGYSNPFVWMYLLPLAVAAVALSWQQTWLIAALVISCYSLLMFWYQPLIITSTKHLHAHGASAALHLQDEGFNLHLLGMWSGFVVSAMVIAFFVERMGRNLREYDRLLAQSREKVLASERMLSLGTLATGAAHELGTPLSTMAVITQDLAKEYSDNPELADSLRILRKQVDQCKQILSSITASAGMMRSESNTRIALDEFIQQIVQRWRDMRPAIPITLELRLPGSIPAIAGDLALSQAITNLINNAADASPQGIKLIASIQHESLLLDIHDQGQFPDAATFASMGQPFISSKQESGGLGLGVFLARSVLEKFEGEIHFTPLESHGTLTSIHIPLANLSLKVDQ